MRWLVRSTIIVLATLLAMAPIAHAETRVALVIGNSAYRNTPALPNPRNDAEAVAEVLTKLGFAVQSGYDLDRTATEQALRAFGETLADADVALFYYAGHGLQVGTENYLLPVDAKLASENDLAFEAIDLNLVLSMMERRPRTNLVFLDACRDNPLVQNLARSMGASRSTALSRGLAIAESGIGTLLVYATQPGAVALDGAGAHSPFTQGLLDYIATPDIEVRQMLTRVRSAVLQATGGKQVPWDHSSLTGDFFFVPRGLVVAPPPTADREVAFWESVKDSRDPADFQAYLDKYPGGTFAALARNRLAALQPQQPVAAVPTPPPAILAPTRQEGLVATLGLEIAELQPNLRAQYGVPAVLEGLVVTGVPAGSEFKPGDVIVEIDRVAVSTRDAFDRQLAAAHARRAASVNLLINRGGVFSMLALPLAE